MLHPRPALLLTLTLPLAFLLSLSAMSCGGPHLRSKTVAAQSYQSTSRCGQGPIDAHFTGEGATWGESIEVRSCGPRGIVAQVLVTVDGAFRNSGPIGWADEVHDNSRCVLRDVEQGLIASNAKGETPAAQPEGQGGAAASSAPSMTTSNSSGFRISDFPGSVCPDGGATVLHLEEVRKGADIHVKIWSDEPNDFEDAFVQVRHLVHWPSVSEKEWRKHLAAKEKKRRERDEKRAAETPSQAELRARIADAEVYTGPTSSPPPAKQEVIPPKVSIHAEWVPGYWHWSAGSWLWIAGDWRVPANDLRDSLTLTASYAPPAMQVEVVPPAPSSDCVWAPGYWSWHNNSYVWIAGVWRLRPSRDAVWTTHTWRVSGSGAIFVPGGWRR